MWNLQWSNWHWDGFPLPVETNQEKMAKLDASRERMMAGMDPRLEKMDTMVLEANWEMLEAVAEQ